jgi:hypothetical protein
MRWVFNGRISGPGSGRTGRRKMQKVKFAKIEISNIANRKNENLENFHRNFFVKIDREIVSRKIVLLHDLQQDFCFFALVLHTRVRAAYLLRAEEFCPKWPN